MNSNYRSGCARASCIQFRLCKKPITAPLLSLALTAVINFIPREHRLVSGYSFTFSSVLFAMCTVVSGCTTINASNYLSATYIGIVHVTAPPETQNIAASSAQLIAIDTHALGLRIQNGIGAGYFHDESYEIPPDCRVIVFVQNEQQLDQLARQFAGFKEGICGSKR